MKTDKLLSNGNYYDLMIDWNVRLENEIPFIRNFISKLKPKDCKILEIGCSTGFHAYELSKLGFNVTGVDIDNSMIEKAREKCSDCDFIVGDVMFVELQNKLKSNFDITISLGNTFGLIAATYGYEAIIRNASQFLIRPHGILLFQVLNTEIERNGWSKPRTVITNEREYIFIRGFKTSEKYIHPEILTLFKKPEQDSWEILAVRSANIPRISSREIISILKKNSFSSIDIYGDYKYASYNPQESIDLIIIARL